MNSVYRLVSLWRTADLLDMEDEIVSRLANMSFGRQSSGAD
jgi:hypothetical protein